MQITASDALPRSQSVGGEPSVRSALGDRILTKFRSPSQSEEVSPAPRVGVLREMSSSDESGSSSDESDAPHLAASSPTKRINNTRSGADRPMCELLADRDSRNAGKLTRDLRTFLPYPPYSAPL